MYILCFLLLFIPALGWADCTKAQLTTELTTDPAALGYAASRTARQDDVLWGLFTSIRAGAAFQINRGVTPAYAVIGVIDDVEFEGMSAIELQRLATMVAPGNVDYSSATVRQTFNRLFPLATRPVSRAALIALANRQGSRSEVVCGRQVTRDEVAAALNP